MTGLRMYAASPQPIASAPAGKPSPKNPKNHHASATISALAVLTTCPTVVRIQHPGRRRRLTGDGPYAKRWFAMWKTLVPAVLLWPVLGAAAGSAEGGENRPGGCVIDRPDKGIFIDIQGKLQKNFFCGTPAPGGKDILLLNWQWRITAQGKTYDLDLGDVRTWYRLAAQHDGKTVRIKGRLEFRGGPETLLQLAKEPAPIFGAWVIVVTDMQPVQEHY